MNPYEGMIQIKIDTLFTGEEAEHPDFETPENTQRISAVTNIKMVEGPEDIPYSVSIQPFVYDGKFFIAKEPGLGNPFMSLEPMTLNEARVGTVRMLAAEGDLDGKVFMLDTGVDQVWFAF